MPMVGPWLLAELLCENSLIIDVDMLSITVSLFLVAVFSLIDTFAFLHHPHAKKNN
jgi:hypothetical protein